LLLGEARLADVNRRYASLLEVLTGLVERRMVLYHSIAEARTREQTDTLRDELLKTLRSLAWAGSDDAAKEARQLQRLIEDEADYIILRRAWHWTNDRRLVSETDPEGRFVAFGKGQRVDRNEAQRLGLIQLEEAAKP
jgi:hypothetical protein